MPRSLATTPPRPRPLGVGPRRGFTLMEMLISITIMSMIFAMAVPFFRAQARSVENNAQRLDARSGGRYGASALDRDLRVAGIGLPTAQPVLVQAAVNAVTVNGDLVSRDTTLSTLAVYANPDADTAATASLTRRTRVTLPNSSWTYPDTTYRLENGAVSGGETISYWIGPDPDRPGSSALLRRVNRSDARVVVRDVVPDTAPVFRYFYVASTGALTEVPRSRLPMRHAVAMHGDAADTGSAGFIDTVRVVRVRLRTLARDAQTGRVDTVAQESSIRIMNAGLLKRSSCGAAPRTVTWYTDAVTPSAVLVERDADGRARVRVSWSASVDEASGERDVQRYVIYRRLATETDFGDPLASVVASALGNYSYLDTDVLAGNRYIYGLASMDCTPTLSEIITSDAVDIPAPVTP